MEWLFIGLLVIWIIYTEIRLAWIVKILSDRDVCP